MEKNHTIHIRDLKQEEVIKKAKLLEFNQSRFHSNRNFPVGRPPDLLDRLFLLKVIGIRLLGPVQNSVLILIQYTDTVLIIITWKHSAWVRCHR